MKVIIQDTDTKEYFSADGAWVAAIVDARDFTTLLRAYHFARENTSRNFQVLLYCPDDAYSADIITGKGVAPAEAVVDRVSINPRAVSRLAAGIRPGNSRLRLNFANTPRPDWN